MKTNDSTQRLKDMMRRQSSLAVTIPAPAAVAPVAPVAPSPPAIVATPASQGKPAVKWDRVTIRLTAGELEKINDVVIATQQANRTAKITTTDVLRVALRCVKDQEAIKGTEIEALRAQDARSSKRQNVRPS
jgi:hypothetical protein